MEIAYIAFGSNLGDRKENINFAFDTLRQDPAINILKTSSIIETEPQKCPPQPKFLNGVVKLETSYSAHQLLAKLQEIEVKLGRKMPRDKNQPRAIDLDILLYGDQKIDDEQLVIPHPRMWKRRFVAIPLREIAPELFTNSKPLP